MIDDPRHKYDIEYKNVKLRRAFASDGCKGCYFYKNLHCLNIKNVQCGFSRTRQQYIYVPLNSRTNKVKQSVINH